MSSIQSQSGDHRKGRRGRVFSVRLALILAFSLAAATLAATAAGLSAWAKFHGSTGETAVLAITICTAFSTWIAVALATVAALHRLID